MREKQKGKMMRLYVQRVIEGFAEVVTYKLNEQRREGQVRHDITRQNKEHKKRGSRKGKKHKRYENTKKRKKKQQKKTRKEGKLKEQ